jgi:hypothetical protein
MPAQTLALSRYDVACRAVAEAKAVDDIVEIVGQANAVHAYARQAKNRQMEIDAAEIRIRAERRLGELMAAQKARSDWGNRGGRRKTGYRIPRFPISHRPSPKRASTRTWPSALGPTPPSRRYSSSSS